MGNTGLILLSAFVSAYISLSLLEVCLTLFMQMPPTHFYVWAVTVLPVNRQIEGKAIKYNGCINQMQQQVLKSYRIQVPKFTKLSHAIIHH